MGPPIFSAVVHHASEPSRLFEQQRRLAPKPFEFLSGSWGDVAITVMELFAARTIRPLSFARIWHALFGAGPGRCAGGKRWPSFGQASY